MAERGERASTWRRRPRHHPFANHRIIAASVLAVVLVLAQRALVTWLDRPLAFLSGLGLVFVLLLLVDWVLDLVGPRLWALVTSVVMSMARAIRDDPEVNRLLDLHPATGGWIRRRFSLASWSGTYLTVTVVVTAYWVSRFVAVARGIWPASALAAADPRVSTLLRAFRAESLTRLMWWATLFGDTRVQLPLTIAVVALLVAWGKRAHAAMLSVTMAGGVVLIEVLKRVAERPRPPVELALIKTPDSFSFPSGHAFMSFVFLGALAFVVFDVAKTVRVRLGALLVAVAGTLLVGLSRVYLGVHWMTDVLASWALAAAWLTVTFGVFLMWRRYGNAPADVSPWSTKTVRVTLAAVLAFVTVVAVAQGAAHDPLLQTALVRAEKEAALSSAQGEGGLPTVRQSDVERLPRFSEKLDGERQAPVGIVFIGERGDLVRAFRKAGWTTAEHPSVLTLLRAGAATVADDDYAGAPVTPSFLGGQVQQLAFQEPVGRPTVRRRHHARFWRTRFTLDGRPVWLATASLDTGIQLGSAIRLPTHRIDPEIDAERDYISSDLMRTGLVGRAGMVRVTRPTAGTNAAGDEFFTEGYAVVLVAR